MSDLNGTEWAVIGATVSAGLLKLADKLLGRRFDEADAVRKETRADRVALEKRVDDLAVQHAIDIEGLQDEIRGLRAEIAYWRDLYHAERVLRTAAETRLAALTGGK